MALSNYTQLKDKVATWLNRADLAGDIPDFIALAEARFRKELRATEIRATFSIDILSADAGAVELDATIRSLQSIALDTQATDGRIAIVTRQVVDYQRNANPSGGIPRFACVQNGIIEVAPVPDTDYTATITADVALTPLSNDAPSNWLLTNYPDLYLYGALIHSAPFLKDDERIQTWKTLHDEQLVALLLERDRAEFGAQPVGFPRKSL